MTVSLMDLQSHTSPEDDCNALTVQMLVCMLFTLTVDNLPTIDTIEDVLEPIQAMLVDLEDFFLEPMTLFSLRSHDHQIILTSGTEVISV